MQFNRDAAGEMALLPSPSIDTGMGFERITTILQGKITNYDTDLFQPLLEEISRLANTEYGADPNDDVSMRIIADHARAATFAVADGQYPGNDKRGYVLRKIMRRAVVHGKKLKIEGPFIFQVSGTVTEVMGAAYPELVQTRETVARVIRQEEESFADTLGKGLRDFYDRTRRLAASGSRVLPGDVAFFLYDTRGLPLEIIEDLAQESGFAVDEAGFDKALQEQRARSRQDYDAGKIRGTGRPSHLRGQERDSSATTTAHRRPCTSGPSSSTASGPSPSKPGRAENWCSIRRRFMPKRAARSATPEYFCRAKTGPGLSTRCTGAPPSPTWLKWRAVASRSATRPRLPWIWRYGASR